MPPRVPQFNWVDLGLPSGTLWLDRLVGAPSPSSPGLYYQWGAVNGHTATDGFSFDDASYREQGLDAISSDLTESQDAARAFYGPSAQMPTLEIIQELIQFTQFQVLRPGVVKLTSSINGESLILNQGGYIVNAQLTTNVFSCWLSNIINNQLAYAIYATTANLHVTTDRSRFVGMPIMAIHA